MKKYKVLRNCAGYKNGGLYYKDSVVEFEDDDTPPHHFELIEGDEPVTKKVQVDGDSLSGLQKMQKEAVDPKTGFASHLKKIQPEVENTVQTFKKKNKK